MTNFCAVHNYSGSLEIIMLFADWDWQLTTCVMACKMYDRNKTEGLAWGVQQQHHRSPDILIRQLCKLNVGWYAARGFGCQEKFNIK